MDKNRTKKSDGGEEAKSVLLDGDDYLVLELLKWPGETDREAIQRILREAIEMPRLKEFVEKLGQQIGKNAWREPGLCHYHKHRELPVCI